MKESQSPVTSGSLPASDHPRTITFSCTEGGGEMLRIAPDGFYVRGEKLQQDAAESQRVYDAFAQWLIHAEHKQQTI